MSPDEQTVFAVDDDPAVLKALTRLLNAEGLRVMAFESPDAFLAACGPQSRGCVVLDVTMPGLNGMELQQALARKACALPVIFLTGDGSIPMSVHAMKQGAVDFLTKPADPEMLIKSVRLAFEQEAGSRARNDEIAEVKARFATLTPREHEVCEYVISGRMNKQIGAALGTTEKTVKVHRARIMDKLRVNSVAELVQLAARAGIIPKA